MKRLQTRLREADPLQRSLAREGAIRCLKRAGIGAATAVVDAALRSLPGDEKDADIQGRALVLSDPEPWGEPVDGALLLSETLQTLTRYVILPPGAAVALSLWILFTHTHDACPVSPLLALKSPTKRAGKTTTLTVIHCLAPRPLMSSNVTPAVLFRTIEKYRPTLLVDEADSFLSFSEELRGLLNSGHTRSGAVVVRSVGDDHEPRQFSTFSPKAIAAIGNLPSTLEDRSILISLRRKTSHEKVDRMRMDRVEKELAPLRSRLARWSTDNIGDLRSSDPSVPHELNDRAADNWRPLLAIADRCGEAWPEDARWAARILSGVAEETSNTPSIQLLADLRDLFATRCTDRLSSKQIVGALVELEDRPWPEWQKGQPITEPQLAKILKPFGVKPKVIRLKDASTPRGYLLAELQDSLSRYLSSEVQQPQQPNEINDLGGIPRCNTNAPVAPLGSSGKPHETGIVAGVALPDPDPEAPRPLESGRTTPSGDPQ